MVDNSRIAGKRTAPEELIVIKGKEKEKGFFKVPEKAAGEPQSRDLVPAQ